MSDSESQSAPETVELQRRQAGRRRTADPGADEAREIGRRQNRPGLVELLRAIVRSERPAPAADPPTGDAENG